MTNSTTQHIFLVDPQPKVRRAVGKVLKRTGLKVSCFACAEDCLERLRYERCDLLITDLNMPGMNGIELIKEAKRIFPELKVLVISGYGSVPMAVKVMKAGATKFIEKPLDKKGFLSTVESILKRDCPINPYVEKILTKAELEVLRLILDGKSSREIANLCHRNIRAIEFHRYNIFKKVGVTNLSDLFKWTAKMGLCEPPSRRQHYLFAHHTLKDLFIKEPEVVINRFRNDKGRAFLFETWNKAGKDLETLNLVAPRGLRYEVRMYDGSITVAIISLPTPEAVSEAYFAALIYRPQKKQQKIITRFILLERSVPLGYSNLSSVLQEWTLDGIHKNIGYGCEPTLEAFYTAVCNLLGK